MKTAWVACVLMAACAKNTATAPVAMEPAPPEVVGPMAADAVAARVADAETRLAATPGGRRVWQAIEAHGGLAAWYQHGTLSFVYDYSPIEDPARRKFTLNEVDLWSSRVRQTELGADADAVFAYDGRETWIAPGPDAFPTAADFWSLTPYYFVAMPFVFADPGTRFEVLDPVSVDGTAYDLVKITYDPAIVAAPDDYYVLYIHPVSHHVEALRYVVTYAGFFPDGGRTPEKFMRVSTLKVVGGIVLPTHVHTHAYDEATGAIGDITTDVHAKKVTFGQTWPVSVFARPEGAVVVP